MSLQLKRLLFSNYGGFADKRVKDIKKDYPFKIDDQSEGDIGERFCHIFIQVSEDERFKLWLANNAPINPDIKKLVASKGGKDRTDEGFSHIELELSIKDATFIKELSIMIRQLVAPGNRYKNQNWKWLCPRIAESLNRFADLLAEYKRKQ